MKIATPGRLESLLDSSGGAVGDDATKMQARILLREAVVAFVKPGQPACIQVDCGPERVFRGHVAQVKSVAVAVDFLKVKHYATSVSIDDPPDALLKTGISAEVTIFLRNGAPVLVIPVRSVVGFPYVGATRKCVVVGPFGLAKERDIRLGVGDDELIEVVDGLGEGDKVILDPSALFPKRRSLWRQAAEIFRPITSGSEK